MWRQGKHVVLSNLTFAAPRSSSQFEPITDALVRIDHHTLSAVRYFPELYLSYWLKANDYPDSVYCIERTGVVPMRAAYAALTERERVDAIIVVDGGTDSLMSGDEAGLGTPHEDAATMVAIGGLRGARPSVLACLGFGVDAFHGVCHAHFLENVAALAKQGAFLGTTSLTLDQEEAEAYVAAVDFASTHEPTHPSIVNTSIAAAIRGEFGDYHSTARTRGSELFINPLMSMYWFFALPPVVDRLLYRDQVEPTETWGEVIRTVQGMRSSLEGRRPYRSIPG